ncbi:MAG: hypothetical protein HY369_01365 [Candidatus Aenigmarchaeota archaeon]|nr:hypothetical protein [Candidatus Aenigmarchaeota archaeon]
MSEKSDGRPRAVVRMVGGKPVLDDPDAVTMVRAVEKHNCRATLEANADRVAHFVRRAAERGLSASEAVIVVLNVDDVHGGQLANVLMPGHDWQQFRDRGEIPTARGLAPRNFIQDLLGTFDEEAATKLQAMTGLAVVVIDRGVAEVFPA